MKTRRDKYQDKKMQRNCKDSSKNQRNCREFAKKSTAEGWRRWRKVVVTNFVTNFLHEDERERKALDTKLWNVQKW